MGDGGCIYKKIIDRTEWIGKTEFTRGDWAVAIKWWIKSTGVDSEELTYEEWVPSDEAIDACGVRVGNDAFFVVNSTEIRHIDFQMEPCDPPAAPVVVPLRRGRSAASATPVQPSVEGRRFCLPSDVENQILALCWSGKNCRF